MTKYLTTNLFAFLYVYYLFYFKYFFIKLFYILILKRKIYQKIFINIRDLLFLKRNFFENEYNENKIHCNFSIKYFFPIFTFGLKKLKIIFLRHFSKTHTSRK